MVRKHSYTVRADKSSEADDLTLINGIGPTLSARLNDIGILTFTQLADLSPEDIASRVIGRSAKRIASENWIQQARKLAPQATTHQFQESGTANEFRQHYATFTVELLLDEDNSVRRTRATYVQNKLEETWAGWEEPRLTDFFVRCAGFKIPLSESALPNEPISQQDPDLILEKVAPPMQTSEAPYKDSLPTSKPKDSLEGVLRVSKLETIQLDPNLPQHIAHTNKKFIVRVLLDLTELKVSPLIPLKCSVTIWAKKLGKAERQIIGNQERRLLPVEKTPCEVESIIPSKGIYRLEALVTLTPEAIALSPRSTIKAWLESGPLQVY